MINICIYCNPNYNSKKIPLLSSKKNIDIVSQFVVLYYSIKQNWKTLEYRITLFYNLNIKWSKEDWDKISTLDIDIIGCPKSDHPNFPWHNRLVCFRYPLKNVGTHRLVLDCDMIAMAEPEFDLECDWQAMFSLDSLFPRQSLYPVTFQLIHGECPRYYNYMEYNEIINKSITTFYTIKSFMQSNNIQLPEEIINETQDKILNINIEKEYLQARYHLGEEENWKNFFPHFNFGAILIKDHLASQFADLFSIGYNLINIFPKLHCELEFYGSYCLRKLSSNWKPFKPGFNICTGLFTIEQLQDFKINNKLSLIHYAQTPICPNAIERILPICEEYFNIL